MRGAMQMERRITASAGGAWAEITNSFIARRGVRGIISDMIPFMKSRVWMLALASLVSTASASDVSDVLTEAQRAYLRNDYAAAKEKFEMVRKVDPTNRTAIAYLRLIAVEEQKSGGKVTRNDTEAACRKLIMEKVDLREASLAEALDFLKQKAATVHVRGNREYNPGWHTALDLPNLLTVSEAITRCAIERKESRGGHFREDMPDKDPAFGTFNFVITKGTDGEMQLKRETIPEMPAHLKAAVEENR